MRGGPTGLPWVPGTLSGDGDPGSVRGFPPAQVGHALPHWGPLPGGPKDCGVGSPAQDFRPRVGQGNLLGLGNGAGVGGGSLGAGAQAPHMGLMAACTGSLWPRWAQREEPIQKQDLGAQPQAQDVRDPQESG